MADTQQEILYEIKELKSWLYGADGHEGDIPEIKKAIGNHGKRIRIIEIVIAGLMVSGGGTLGIIKLLN